MADLHQIYDHCPACHGQGYWLAHYMKKDGTEAKRRKRFPCPACKGKRAVPPFERKPMPEDDGIPF